MEQERHTGEVRGFWRGLQPASCPWLQPTASGAPDRTRTYNLQIRKQPSAGMLKRRPSSTIDGSREEGALGKTEADRAV